MKMKKKNVAGLLGTVLLMSVTASAMAADTDIKPQTLPVTPSIQASISELPSSQMTADKLSIGKTDNYLALEKTEVTSSQVAFKVNSSTKDGLEVFRVNEDKLNNGGIPSVEVTSGVVSREDLEGVLKDLNWTAEKKETTLKNFDQNIAIQNQLETLYRGLENADQNEVKQTLDKAQQLQATATDIFEKELLNALIAKGILVNNENNVQIMDMTASVSIEPVQLDPIK